MKCFFPKVTSIQQKIFCAGSGVLFTTAVVKGIGHCPNPIPHLFTEKQIRNTERQITNVCQIIKCISDDYVFKKYWAKISKLDHFDSIIRYLNIIFFMVYPIAIGHEIYDDWKKITRTNECCVIIRHAAIQTVFFPFKIVLILLSIALNYSLIFESELI
jgi:hypothetical protein